MPRNDNKGHGDCQGCTGIKTAQAALLFHRHARVSLGHLSELSRPTTAAAARSNEPGRADEKKRKRDVASANSMQVTGEGDEDEDYPD